MRTNITSAASLQSFLDSLLSWAADDPQAALDYAMKNLKLRRQEQAIGAILGEWTKRNPEAAWNWATNKVANNPQYIDEVLSQLGKTDSSAAWDFAITFAASHTNAARSTYVGALRGMTYAGDFATAAQYLQNDKLLSTDDRTAVASLLIASEWGLHNPEQAVNWANSLPADDPARDQVMAQLGMSWSSTDPSSAADFGAQLPTGDARQQVVARAVDNWIDSDPAAVTKFLSELPSSSDFDAAFERTATHPAIAINPINAISLAQAITDPELRTQAFTKIIGAWMQRDPSAATSYLQNTTDLSSQMRSQVSGRLANQDLYSTGDE